MTSRAPAAFAFPALLSLASVFLTTAAGSAQDTHPVTGRQIANVMGVGGADWLTREERLKDEQPDLALDLIGIPTGAVVADVGAGVGYFSWRLAERVGPTGKVYSTDIQQGMLDLLSKNISARGLKNVVPVLGKVDDPMLPAGTFDLILMVDVYHEFSEPQKMLHGLRKALKPDGRMVLLEFRGEDPNVPVRAEHKMTVKGVRAELEPEGFVFQKGIEKLPRQHILIFGRTKDQ